MSSQRTVRLSSFNYASMHHKNIAYSTYLTEARAAHAYSSKFPTRLSRCHMCLLTIASVLTARHTRQPQTVVCSAKLENNVFLRE